ERADQQRNRGRPGRAGGERRADPGHGQPPAATVKPAPPPITNRVGRRRPGRAPPAPATPARTPRTPRPSPTPHRCRRAGRSAAPRTTPRTPPPHPSAATTGAATRWRHRAAPVAPASTGWGTLLKPEGITAAGRHGL